MEKRQPANRQTSNGFRFVVVFFRFARGGNRNQILLQLILGEPAPMQHDAVLHRDITHVLQGIGVEQNQIGDFALRYTPCLFERQSVYVQNSAFDCDCYGMGSVMYAEFCRGYS